MKQIFFEVLNHSRVEIYPTIGLILLFSAMMGICFYTFRPKSKQEYQKRSNLTLD